MEPIVSRAIFFTKVLKKHDDQKPKMHLGRLEIDHDSLTFLGEGESVFIPFPSIKEVYFLTEPTPYLSLTTVLALNIFILTRIFFFQQKLEIATVYLLLMAIVFLLDFFYLNLKHRRRWIYVIYGIEDEKLHAYFTYDWRKNPFKLPWRDQDKLWMWLLKRGELVDLYKKIVKLVRSS